MVTHRKAKSNHGYCWSEKKPPGGGRSRVDIGYLIAHLRSYISFVQCLFQSEGFWLLLFLRTTRNSRLIPPNPFLARYSTQATVESSLMCMVSMIRESGSRSVFLRFSATALANPNLRVSLASFAFSAAVFSAGRWVVWFPTIDIAMTSSMNPTRTIFVALGGRLTLAPHFGQVVASLLS